MGESLDGEVFVRIDSDVSIVLACQRGRQLAAQMQLSDKDQVVVVIAISEVAWNILHHADHGEILLEILHEKNRDILLVVARDWGKGIPDIARAMQDGYSTGDGLGIGLSGAKRLMDEFEIVSEIGYGTIVTMKKWGY